MIRRFLLLIGIVLLIVSYQNCERTPSLYESHDTTYLFGGVGNGEGYDGKLTSYNRFVPGLGCENGSNEYASIQYKNKTPYITVNEKNQCGSPQPVASADIVHSLNTSQYIGYKEGVYKQYLSGKSSSYVEAWCRPVEAKHKGLEVFVELNKETKASWGLVFDPLGGEMGLAEATGTRTDFRKEIYYHKVEFFGKAKSSFNLSISLEQKSLKNPHEFKGTLRGFRNSELKNLEMKCRMGGQFDPVAPRLRYERSFHFLIREQQMSPELPLLNKSAESYEVSPELPDGLEIDSLSGAIMGKPIKYSKIKSYTVTARFRSGLVSTIVNIGIGQDILVSDFMAEAESEESSCHLSSLVCVLRQALLEAQNLGLPAQVSVPSGKFLLAGEPLNIKGEVKLIGEGLGKTIIDAQGLSRILHVQEGSHIELEGISMINGRVEGKGGALLAEKSDVIVRSVEFNGNESHTMENGQGGAIHALGGRHLKIVDSTFINNKTYTSGTNIRGGAVYSYGHDKLTLIKGSVFKSNQSVRGGGLYIFGGYVNVINSQFISNSGGGLFLDKMKFIFIEKSDFLNNKAPFSGSGLSLYSVNNSTILESNFKNNFSRYGSAIYTKSHRSKDETIILNSTLSFDESFVKTLSRVEQRYYRASYFSLSLVYSSYKGHILFGQSVLQNKGKGKNCDGTYLKVDGISKIFSIGHNISNDESCQFNMPSDQIKR